MSAVCPDPASDKGRWLPTGSRYSAGRRRVWMYGSY